MGKNKKFLPPNFLFLYLLLALALHFFFPIKQIMGNFRFLGIFFIAFGIGINLWTDHLFKKFKTTVKPDQKPTSLITQGPFSFSRHPMYLGFVLLLLGVAMVLGSLSSFTAPVLMFITLQKKFIFLEEKQMEKYFGQKYLDYQKRVRCWF